MIYVIKITIWVIVYCFIVAFSLITLPVWLYIYIKYDNAYPFIWALRFAGFLGLMNYERHIYGPN